MMFDTLLTCLPKGHGPGPSLSRLMGGWDALRQKLSPLYQSLTQTWLHFYLTC